MKILEILARFGIPERAGAVYLSLLEHGDGKIADIAERTGFYRAYVYRFLPYLVEKNLVHPYMRGKQRYYKANPPETLLALEDALRDTLRTAVAHLESRAKKRESGIFAYGVWQDAIRDALVRQIEQAKRDETIVGYSSRSSDFPAPLLPEHARILRKEKGIARLLVATEARRAKKSKDPLRQIAVVPKDEASFGEQISKSVQGDTVTIVNYGSQEVFSITDKHLADFEREIFYLLFRRL